MINTINHKINKIKIYKINKINIKIKKINIKIKKINKNKKNNQ